MVDNLEFDVAIIGGGPAGLTAAIYSQRANLKSCFIEQSAPGGKMVNTAKIENYPGFKEVDGPELSLNMFNQATQLGSTYIGAGATQIKSKDGYKYVNLNNGKIIKAKVVIIAIGTINRKLEIPGEDKFFGRGVSYCAICDGMFFKDKPIAVVGGGNSALEESIYLSTLGKEIHLIHRREEFRADPSVVDEVKKNEKIQIHYNSVVNEIKGDDKVSSVIIENKKTGEKKEIKVDAVFPFVGLVPLEILLDGAQLEKTSNGFIKVNKEMETNIDGIFAIGDITDKKYRQISTAINDGTISALSAKEYINKHFK